VTSQNQDVAYSTPVIALQHVSKGARIVALITTVEQQRLRGQLSQILTFVQRIAATPLYGSATNAPRKSKPLHGSSPCSGQSLSND
jgi:hypothetical protein